MHAQGKFTITVRDADTLEEKRVIEKDNIVTDFGEWRIHMGKGMLTSNDGYSGARYDDIVISPDKMVAGVDLAKYIRNRYGSGSNIHSPTYFEPTEDSPAYLELYQRFQPAASVREINSIYISQGSHYRAFAYAGLVEPCIQGTNEVLDIFYRIQFIPGVASTDNDKYSISSNYAEFYAWQAATKDNEQIGAAQYGTPYYGKPPKPGTWTTTSKSRTFNASGYNQSIFNITTREYDHFNWMHKQTYSLTVDDYVGQAWGMIAYGKHSSADNTTAVYDSTLITPFVPLDFPYKPIQPIHRHTHDAPHPFLDVDFLASSTGVLEVNGDNWEKMEDGFPEWQRVDFVKSGAVGTTRYKVAERNLISFYFASFRGNNQVFPYLNTREGYPYYEHGHGMQDMNTMIEFNDECFIMGDDTGITILSAATGTTENYDANSTPAMPVTAYRQVCTSNQVIYVACADTGLYKIENAWNDDIESVVTHLSTTPCHAVDIGKDGVMYAIFDGSLSRSDDNGVTWTDQNFVFSKISDSWDKARSLHIDRESDDHTMLIKYYNPDNSNNYKAETVWFDKNGRLGAGPTLEWNLYEEGGRSRLSKARCSRYGSFWVGCNRYNQKLFPYTPGTVYIGDTTDYQRYNNATFAYDKNKNPYVVAYYTYTNGQMRPGLYSKDLERHNALEIGSGHFYDSYSYASIDKKGGNLFAFEENGGNGLFIWTNGLNYSTDSWDYNSDAIKIQMMTPQDYGVATMIDTDNWNGKGTIYEDIAYNKYGWNGSEWVKGYNMPAADTSNHDNHCNRLNFHQGDSEFYGNSFMQTPNLTLDRVTALATFTPKEAKTDNPDAYEPKEAYSPNRGTLIGFEGTDYRVRLQNGVLETITNGNLKTSYDLGEEFDMTAEHRVATSLSYETDAQYSNFPTNWGKAQHTTSEMQVTFDNETLEFYMWRNEYYYHYLHAFLNDEKISNNFRLSFNRYSSRNYSGQNNENWAYSSHGRHFIFMYDAAENNPHPVSKGNYWYGKPAITDRMLGILMPNNTNRRPALITRWDIDTPDWNTTNFEYDNEYKWFDTVNHFTEGDFNGTNTISIDYTHDGTTFTINIYSNDGANGDILKYTVTADITNVPAFIAPQLMWWHANGHTSSNITERYTNVLLGDVGTTLSPTYTAPGRVAKTWIDGTLVAEETIPAAGQITAVNFGGASKTVSGEVRGEGFFKGTMKDMQIWDANFTDDHVADDFSQYPTPTSSVSSTLRIGTYLNRDNDEYLDECKLTHAEEEPLFKGLTTSFTPGSSEPSFSDGDFFSYGIIDGILKDNAINISGEYKWHTKRLQEETIVEDLADPGNNDPVIPATQGAKVTDYVCWTHRSNVMSRPGRIVSDYNPRTYEHYHSGMWTDNDSWGNRHSWSFDYVEPGVDTELEWTISLDHGQYMIGFDERPDITDAYTDLGNGGYGYLNHAFYIKPDGYFTIYESYTHRSEINLPYDAGDIFRIERNSGVVTYYQNDELVYTSTVTSNDYVWMSFKPHNELGSCIHDCTMSFHRPANILYLGDSQTLKGRWDEDFLRLEPTEAAYSVTIDGVEQIVIMEDNKRIISLYDPVPGEVVISQDAGIIKFHPDEAGKNVQVTYRGIMRK